MNVNEYKKSCAKTDWDYILEVLDMWWTVGAGEVADLVKKHVCHCHQLDSDKLTDKICDFLWYLAMLADAAGATLSEVMESNLKKIRRRYPEVFI